MGLGQTKCDISKRPLAFLGLIFGVLVFVSNSRSTAQVIHGVGEANMLRSRLAG